ncbi:hypothetical protein [Mangrovihabitans endophyticus]|uniref:Uncharacterized protein n=1 Tax=Mangrovihabitans endophyticus TaxID=1751298 RepID=A0A8J3C858_9ACTN|nr:hypothetical protein [Mangrovihabitans endophyticus]GGL18927.1 hypothetical protein GCM10012284_61870 [Mangrovihabitans endophyticus]
MSNDPLDAELEEMTGSRPLTDALRRSLERLKNGVAGPDLAEMANDVLEGRTTLRAVARSSAYSDPITGGIHSFQRWQAGLTPQQRRQFETDAQEAIGHNTDLHPE